MAGWGRSILRARTTFKAGNIPIGTCSHRASDLPMRGRSVLSSAAVMESILRLRKAVRNFSSRARRLSRATTARFRSTTPRTHPPPPPLPPPPPPPPPPSPPNPPHPPTPTPPPHHPPPPSTPPRPAA